MNTSHQGSIKKTEAIDTFSLRFLNTFEDKTIHKYHHGVWRIGFVPPSVDADI